MKKILPLAGIVLCSFVVQTQVNADLLIRNGKIYDGTGNSWYYGDLAIKDGKIIKTGYVTNIRASKMIDAQGLLVAPGFIDVHGHIEGGIITNPLANNYIFDGVTTVITGNCGGSADNIKSFLEEINRIRTSINVASLIGHNTVRAQVMNRDDRKPTVSEQQKMDALVDQAMKEGAVGLSTGLIYIPGTYAETEEVIALAKAAAKNKGVYASHIRNEEN